MKKYVIILLGVVVLVLAIAYVKLFARQAQYQQMIDASTSSVLALENFDRGRIQIVTADTDKITVDFRGSAQDIVNLLQSENGDLITIDFAGKSAGLSGTIVVPRGMLIDVELSGDATIDINDAGGKKSINGKKSFLIDTTNLNSFGVDKSGKIILDGWGDLIVWDDKKWDLLDGNGDSGEGADNGSPDTAPYCGVGSQAIRNYCCVTQKKDMDTPACNGTGRWVFDNIVRDCAYKCEPSEKVADEPVNAEADCGIGTQVTRNNCCALRFAGQYQGCIGSWNYNNAARNCEFVCISNLPPDDEGDGDGTHPISYGDSVSDYCATIQKTPDKDICCNDALKNGLSSGPHPGYPDCIGIWYFDTDKGCEFRCAEYTEMMKILNEIRQKAQNQQ